MTLSTIHSAKGLEWYAVFIIWAAEGRFPAFYSMEKPEEAEEERRLMYVAVTRAKRHVAVIFPTLSYNRNLGMTFNSPSRYIADLPRSLLERWRVEVEEKDRFSSTPSRPDNMDNHDFGYTMMLDHAEGD